MSRKKFFVFIAIITIFVAAIFCGFAPKSRGVNIALSMDGTVTNYFYETKFSTAFRKAVLYGGSYEKFYEKEFSGNPKGFLEYLNNKIIVDIDKVCDENHIPPTEATAVFTKEGFSYEEGKSGSKIDKEKLLKNIVFSLDLDRAVFVEKEEILPTVTIEELKEETAHIASFSTDYSTSSAGRKANISMACDRLDLTVVPPHGVIGFNGIVGERTKENGFSDAKIIKNGEFVDGVGGGVCQVSTTLYNAWLLAGGEVPEASTHSLPVSYVLPSLDAMVSSASDLVLLNPTDRSAYIRVSCDGRKIVVSVYGKKPEFDVKLRSEKIKTIAASYEIREEFSTEEGTEITKEGKDGLISESYRDYYKDGVLVKSERLRRSYYSPIKGEIVVKKYKY